MNLKYKILFIFYKIYDLLKARGVLRGTIYL